ncbi:hypothetical protein POTOM_038591 [Populus tomentosa]|uniref:Uncharacterized protein n=1 Tax=Populus tomentosa TaxID=118781 RepID=A0A8X7Z181_POPTO|nr:hypothetical protein POTOM_038591 [Populus tomentosa]
MAVGPPRRLITLLKRHKGGKRMGFGTGLAVGAVAGALGGLALEEGLKYEEKIAEKVENDLALFLFALHLNIFVIALVNLISLAPDVLEWSRVYLFISSLHGGIVMEELELNSFFFPPLLRPMLVERGKGEGIQSFNFVSKFELDICSGKRLFAVACKFIQVYALHSDSCFSLPPDAATSLSSVGLCSSFPHITTSPFFHERRKAVVFAVIFVLLLYEDFDLVEYNILANLNSLSI